MTSCRVLLRVLFRGVQKFYNLLLHLVFCNVVVIDAGIFPITQAQAYVQVFDLAAFVYMYFTFTSLEVVVELCTLHRYEVIVLK